VGWGQPGPCRAAGSAAFLAGRRGHKPGAGARPAWAVRLRARGPRSAGPLYTGSGRRPLRSLAPCASLWSVGRRATVRVFVARRAGTSRAGVRVINSLSSCDRPPKADDRATATTPYQRGYSAPRSLALPRDLDPVADTNEPSAMRHRLPAAHGRRGACNGLRAERFFCSTTSDAPAPSRPTAGQYVNSA